MSEITITDTNYEKEIASDIPIVVDFWASWCGPCKMLAPIFEELSKEYPKDKLRFGKCSTEEYQDIAAKNEISGIPCLIVFKKNEEIGRIIGFHNKQALKQKLDSFAK